MKCEYCGRIIKKGEVICPGCGAEVIEETKSKAQNNVDKEYTAEAEKREKYAQEQSRNYTYTAPIVQNTYNLYAGFARRFAACCIDVMIVSLMVSLFGVDHLSTFISWLLIGAYFIGFEVKKNGQTLGKRLVGIRVISLNSREITVGQSVVRYIGKAVSAFILGLGYLMPLITTKRQALHDYMAHTAVIKG